LAFNNIEKFGSLTSNYFIPSTSDSGNRPGVNAIKQPRFPDLYTFKIGQISVNIKGNISVKWITNVL